MDPIRIEIKKHIRTLLFEFSVLLFWIILSLPSLLLSYNNDRSIMLWFIVFWGVIILAHIVFAVYFNRWVFPEKISIGKECIEIECRFLFLLPKRYCWKKEDVIIMHKTSTLFVKISSIIISNKTGQDRVVFESIAINKDRMASLLCELKAKGYTFDSKESIVMTKEGPQSRNSQ